jgi:thioredoxin reductase (NADPH)
MKNSNSIEEIVIIGGGPAGLSAAIYNARANLNPLVFAGSPPGGQLTLTTEVENYPGYESIMGPDLIMKMRDQATHFEARIRDLNVKSVDLSVRPFVITPSSEGDAPVKAHSLIIATGARAIWLGLPNEQRLMGRGVSACATCDGFFFRNKTVAVVGGGDTAMEDATTLTKFAAKVYIIHRRNEFRASKIMRDRVLANPKIEVVWESGVEDVLGDDKVTGVRVKNLSSGTTNDISLDGLFIAIGHKPDTDIFQESLILDRGYVVTSQMVGLHLQGDQAADWQQKASSFDARFPTMTSVPGVFAAGDCVDFIYRQASTSVGSGVAASLDAERWLETQHA